MNHKHALTFAVAPLFQGAKKLPEFAIGMVGTLAIACAVWFLMDVTIGAPLRALAGTATFVSYDLVMDGNHLTVWIVAALAVFMLLGKGVRRFRRACLRDGQPMLQTVASHPGTQDGNDKGSSAGRVNVDLRIWKLDVAELDYYVALALGMSHPTVMREMAPGFVMIPDETEDEDGSVTMYRAFSPAGDWRDGGPLLESEGISVVRDGDRWLAGYQADGSTADQPRQAANPDDVGAGFEGRFGGFCGTGDTVLVAAMRTFVARHYASQQLVFAS